MTSKDREEKQQLDTHIECEDLLDTSILDADEPTDEELSDIEVDGLMEDVYNLVNELDSYIEELW